MMSKYDVGSKVLIAGEIIEVHKFKDKTVYKVDFPMLSHYAELEDKDILMELVETKEEKKNL